MISQVVLYTGIVVVVIANLVSRYVLRHEEDPLKKTLKLFRLQLVFMGGFCILLWFFLPSTPVLSTFGYPRTESDIQSAKSLLYYLQESNQALVRTTQVLFWFIFVFVWWFMTTLFDLSKTLSAKLR
jgi:hypothetical protein